MKYYFEKDRVVREDGYIAAQHFTANATAIRVDGVIYNFGSSHNISLAWISPTHIDKVLGEMARICCGKTGKKFFLSSLINVNIWTYNKREGE